MTDKSTYALELRGVNMFYGSRQILYDMNLRLEPNRIYGLLGRNGAGKTTLINVISAQIFSSHRGRAGEALVFGHSAFESPDTLRRLCVVREKTNMPDNLSVENALKAAAGFYPNWDAEYASHLVGRFGLDPYKRYKALSRGMESALGLVIGLASRAPLTIFDEPSLGLDAAAREYFYDELAADHARAPRTVIISTHMIDEVARLFQDIVIMERGHVMLSMSLSELRSRAVTVVGAPDDVARQTMGLEILGDEVLSADAAEAPLSVIEGDAPQYMTPAEWARAVRAKVDTEGMLARTVWLDEGHSFEQGVALRPVSLQRLFVYLTEEVKG